MRASGGEEEGQAKVDLCPPSSWGGKRQKSEQSKPRSVSVERKDVGVGDWIGFSCLPSRHSGECVSYLVKMWLTQMCERTEDNLQWYIRKDGRLNTGVSNSSASARERKTESLVVTKENRFMH